MGSILSKLFGGGGNHHGSGSKAPTPASSPASTLQRPQAHQVVHQQQQQQTTTNASLVNKTIPIGKPLDSASLASSVASSVTTTAPVNILEVEVDEDAFKETPQTYTSTIKAQIDQSPPHPLEQQLYTTSKTQVSITKETKITREYSAPDSPLARAPIARLDSDIESEISSIQQENAEIEEAVIKIQAGVRGFLVRKHVNQQKSNSVDDPTSMEKQQQDTILPPPENFESSGSGSLLTETSGSVKSNLVTIKKRVETPIPGSPPDNHHAFIAQDDTNYSLLDDTVDPVETLVTSGVATATTSEELEIFKKINEINQLLAARNDDDDIEIVPEPPKSSPNVQESVTPIGTTTAISSNSINTALNELDQTIREQEKKLLSEADDEVLVLESAFSANADAVAEAIQSRLESLIPPTPQSPSVLVKAPSLEQEDEAAATENTSLTEEAAAIRIQAAFRGYEVRKSLSREPSPAGERNPNETEPENKSEPQPVVEEPIVEEIKTEETNLPVQPEEAEPVAPVQQSEPQQPEPVQENLIPLTELSGKEVIADPPEESLEPESVEEIKQDVPKPVESQPEPKPIEEELIPVTELSDEEVIKDELQPEPSFEPELKPVKEEEEAVKRAPEEVDNAQIVPDVIPSAAEEAALMSVAVKDGFGVVAAEMAAVDIEKSIQELEKSFDRDLLSDPTTEVAPAAAPTTATKPVEPVTVSELISVEPATPDIQKQTSPPVFAVSEEPTAPSLPSKIPVLDRSKSNPTGILKEPSSPEPNAYLNLALPTCVSPSLSDSTTANDGGDENTDDEASESAAPSPIPLRASSPSPFSKKRHRRHRGNKKK